MTGSIDDEETGNLVLLGPVLVHDSGLGLDRLHREVSGTDLLRDTSSFAFLDIRLTNLWIDM